MLFSNVACVKLCAGLACATCTGCYAHWKKHRRICFEISLRGQRFSRFANEHKGVGHLPQTVAPSLGQYAGILEAARAVRLHQS